MAFLDFGALLGLLAIGIPIAIHLLNKFQVKRVHWAAMRFLLESIQRNQRRVKIEDLILLLLRCLLVILLALAFARPVFFRSAAGGSSMGSNVVLIVDDSMSMTYQDGPKSNFALGQEAALDALSKLGSDNDVALYLVSDRVQQAVSPPTRNLNVIRDAIHAASASSRSSDVWPGVQAAVNQLSDLDGPGKIIVVTDEQVLAWRHRQEIDALLGQSQGRISLDVVPVGHAPEPNVAVSSVQLEDNIPTVNQPLRVAVRVTNWGTVPVPSIKVSLAADAAVGTVTASSSVLGPAQSETLSLPIRFNDAGFHSLTASIPPDRLNADNQRSLALEVLNDLHVLLVEGGPASHLQDTDGFYLANALVPVPPNQQNQYYLKVQRGTTAELEKNLDQYRAIFLVNVPQLTTAAETSLATFTKRGGGLVIFPGDKVHGESFAAGDLKSLLPAQLEAPRDVAPHQVLAWQGRGYSHPLTAAWNNPQNGDLGQIHVRRYWPLALAGSAGHLGDSTGTSETVASYADGQVAVAARDVGKGHIIVFGTAANSKWGNLPLQPTFVPLIYRLVGYLVKQPAHQTLLKPGDVFTEMLPSEAAGKRFLAHEPGDPPEKRVTGTIELENDHALLRFGDTEIPGPYEIYLEEGSKPQATFAVQTDPEESNLNRLAPGTLAAELKMQTNTTKNAGAQALATNRVTGELWLPVFCFALAAALLESFLAYLFSRNR